MTTYRGITLMSIAANVYNKVLLMIIRDQVDPMSKLCRRYDLYVRTHGRRRPGRQRESYISYVQRLLRDAEGDLHKDAIASLATNLLT